MPTVQPLMWMRRAGGVDAVISEAADEPGGNVRMGETLNVERLLLKAPHELAHDHLGCFTS